MKITKIFRVVVKKDFYIEEIKLTKYFKEEDDANMYLDSIMENKLEVPTIAYIETKLAILDEDKYFCINYDYFDLCKEVFIDFAYFQPATNP